MPGNTTAGTLRWALDPAVTHLNHGSFGAVPEAVLAEQQRLRRQMEANPVRWFAALPERVAAARREMARLLAVDASHLAFVLNDSAGASTVFASLLATGPVNVLVTNHGYGAVTMGAERLARRSGGTAATVTIPLAATAVDATRLVCSALAAHRPRLLVIDQVTSATARALPVDDICRAARAEGVTTLVDGAHAPGMLADPICREADYWIGNLHKFACAPRGAAVLVARGDGQELFPVIDSWGAPLPFPERFDHIGTLDVTAWLAAPYAWRHIDDAVGWDIARERTTALLDEGTAVVAEALGAAMDDPIPAVGQPVGGLRLLHLPGGLGGSREAADGLRVPFNDEAHIACAFSHFEGRGFLRLSAHLYNTMHDFRRFADVGVPVLHRWARESQSAPGGSVVR